MDRIVPVVAFSTAALYAVSRLAVEYTVPAAWACAAAVIGSFVYVVFIYPFFVSRLRNLPGPKGGRFPWYDAAVIRKQNHGEPFRTWVNSVPNNGVIRYRVLLNKEAILITSPAALKEVLVTKCYDFIKPPSATFLIRHVLGNGVLFAEGDDHKRQRKALSPAFSFRHIKDLYPLFWSKSREVTDAIASKSLKGDAQSVYEWASRVTLDLIGLAGFGHDFNSVSNPDQEVNRIYQKLFSREPPIWDQLGIAVPLSLLIHVPIPLFAVAKRAATVVKAVAYDMVRQKRSAVAAGKLGEVDILSAAMDSGQFNDDALVAQCMTFLAAGHETTASAMSWAIYLLCKHPEVQTRLREEVRANLPSIRDPESTVSALEVDRLTYLNGVCNETLRLIPSVPLTRRYTVRDVEIAGELIPKGTKITISPWAINGCYELWGPDALEFKPERWVGEGKANSGGAQSNFSFLTFLHGPRSCIGKDFSKAEFMCLLATWIGRFEVSFANPQAMHSSKTYMEGRVTVKPRDKLPVNFREIDGW